MNLNKIMQLIRGRVGKRLLIKFSSGEVVNAKVIAADRTLEEDADFYFIDLEKAPSDVAEIGESMRPHVYSGTFDEVEDLEIPQEPAAG